MRTLLFALALPLFAQEDLAPQLLGVKRIFVDRLTGGETAAQMRDLVIASLQGTKLFVLTENESRADAILRGAAEDLIFTDTFNSSDRLNIGASASTGTRTTRTTSPRGLGISAGESDTADIKERKHEALATVRLVNKDGDVIWSTIQESNGAKFRGASADVADKIARQITVDLERLKRRP